MNVSKVKAGISRVASGLVFQTVNQALCVHRNVTRFLLWCGMDRSRTSFEIPKLSNRFERELMDVDPSSRLSLLLAFTTTGGPARPLPSITMHAAGALQCPGVSMYAVNSPCPVLQNLPDSPTGCVGLAANGAGPWKCTAGVTSASTRTRYRRTEARTGPGPLCLRNGRPHPGFPGEA